MPLLEEYRNRRENPPTEIAKRILFALMNDILGRKGYDDVWDDTDGADKEELLQTNLAEIQSILSK